MINIFKRDPRKKLQKKYDSLMKENFELSKINRKLADEKYVQAQEILKQMEQL
jgi:hypothetical protein